MEHDARKMTALAILLLLLGAGVVGVGYAAFSGTASTYNEENSATAGYVYLDSANWDAVSVDADDIVAMATYTYHYKTGDTDNDYVAYYFDPEDPATVKSITFGSGDQAVTYSALAIDGATKTYTIHNATNADITTFDFKVKEVRDGGFTTLNASDFVYIMSVKSGTDTKYVKVDGEEETVSLTSTVSKDDVDGTDVILQLYIGYDESKNVALPNDMIGRAYPVSALDSTDAVDPKQSEYDDKQGHEVAKVDLGTKSPLDLDHVDFAFTVEDKTA